MNEYLSVGDEKWVIMEAKSSSFRPVLQRFRVMQISTNMPCWRVFVDEISSVGGFVDENMVFGDYMSECLSDEDEK